MGWKKFAIWGGIIGLIVMFAQYLLFYFGITLSSSLIKGPPFSPIAIFMGYAILILTMPLGYILMAIGYGGFTSLYLITPIAYFIVGAVIALLIYAIVKKIKQQAPIVQNVQNKTPEVIQNS